MLSNELLPHVCDKSGAIKQADNDTILLVEGNDSESHWTNKAITFFGGSSLDLAMGILKRTSTNMLSQVDTCSIVNQ